MVNLTVDIDSALEGLEEFEDDQLPFSTALALTRTAQAGQTDARVLEKEVFTLRNDWTVRNTKIAAATKQNLTATVFTDTANWSSGAPDYLPPQEEGAEKLPVAGHHHLAIPTQYLRKYAPASKPIPDNLRPKNLFPPGATIEIGKVYGGQFRAGRENGERRAISTRSVKLLRGTDYVAFLQYTKGSKTLCIFVRNGRNDREAEPWYVLVSEAQIKARFPMAETVEATVARVFQDEFEKALLQTHPMKL